jgi:hypothetical protein
METSSDALLTDSGFLLQLAVRKQNAPPEWRGVSGTLLQSVDLLD